MKRRSKEGEREERDESESDFFRSLESPSLLFLSSPSFFLFSLFISPSPSPRFPHRGPSKWYAPSSLRSARVSSAPCGSRWSTRRPPLHENAGVEFGRERDRKKTLVEKKRTSTLSLSLSLSRLSLDLGQRRALPPGLSLANQRRPRGS